MKRIALLAVPFLLASCSDGGTYYSSESCDALAAFAVATKTDYIERGVPEAQAIELMRRRIFEDEKRAIFTKAVKYAIQNAVLSNDEMRWRVSHTCRVTDVSKFLDAEISG